MRLISFSVCISVFSLVINFGYGQATNKQYYNLKIESKNVTEYATLFPLVNLDVFEHRDGLPQGTIKTVYQSADGYLWISVLNYGLLRYDGYHFRSFVFGKDDSSSLPTRNIISIVPSFNNGLWLVTDKGLIWFNLKTYQSKVIREIPQRVFETTEGWGCVEDKLGKLWVFVYGLYLYDSLSYRENGSLLSTRN